MESYLLEKYREKLNRAASLMEGKQDAENRKVWTGDERKAWLNREPICKICKQDYTKNNPITKEHVHPLALGGNERSDNIDAICERCNSARNKVMYSVLSFKSVSDLRKRWPANKTSVNEFIIWCHVSIYGTVEEMELFSHINESFGIARNIQYPIESTEDDKPVPLTSQSFMDRVRKIWKPSKKKTPSKKFEKTCVILCPGCTKKLSFPENYDGRFRCPSCSLQGLFSDGKIVKSRPILEATDDGFKDLIFEFIGPEPITLNNLGNLLKSKFRQEGYEDINTTKILEWFGYPKGFKKSLLNILGEEIVIDETDPSKVTVRTNDNPLSPQRQDSVGLVDDVQEEPAINGDKFRNLVFRIHSEEPSHHVYSVLSVHKIQLGAFLGKLNNRLEELELYDKSNNFFDFFGLSKKGGFRKHITENYSDYIQLTQDAENEHIWYSQLKYSNYLSDIRCSLLDHLAVSESTELTAFELWGIIKSQRKEIDDISTAEFWRRLGIPIKGTALEKVWRVVERLDLDYTAIDFFKDGSEARLTFDL